MSDIIDKLFQRSCKWNKDDPLKIVPLNLNRSEEDTNRMMLSYISKSMEDMQTRYAIFFERVENSRDILSQLRLKNNELTKQNTQLISSVKTLRNKEVKPLSSLSKEATILKRSKRRKTINSLETSNEVKRSDRLRKKLQTPADISYQTGDLNHFIVNDQ